MSERHSLGNLVLNKDEIARRIPHSGRMCLLDSVSEFDEERLVALSNSHRDAQHPLAVDGVLHAAVGIEYAAQAMAVHASLAGEAIRQQGGHWTEPSMGFLASVRDVNCYHLPLNLLTSVLRIEVIRLASIESSVSYSFSVRSENLICLQGRATVVLNFS
jgi:predicted hotdog family 3-hydroxylacyl-ACP dehydratase